MCTGTIYKYAILEYVHKGPTFVIPKAEEAVASAENDKSSVIPKWHLAVIDKVGSNAE